ncbi:MAG: LptF/LptG family permease, partial [Planctomycetes bacterium]|nr:LptF/LptG family permease [Planctomycetota bacterium]
MKNSFNILPTTDWYFTRRFLSLFALVFLALVVVIICADLMQKSDEFSRYANESGKGTMVVIAMIIEYYLTFAPAMVFQDMMPLVTVLAGVITVTTAAIHNEFVVLRSSGVSLVR